MCSPQCIIVIHWAVFKLKKKMLLAKCAVCWFMCFFPKGEREIIASRFSAWIGTPSFSRCVCLGWGWQTSILLVAWAKGTRLQTSDIVRQQSKWAIPKSGSEKKLEIETKKEGKVKKRDVSFLTLGRFSAHFCKSAQTSSLAAISLISTQGKKLCRCKWSRCICKVDMYINQWQVGRTLFFSPPFALRHFLRTVVQQDFHLLSPQNSLWDESKFVKI